MCKIVEDMCTQRCKENTIEIALRMIKAGRYALEEIAGILNLPLDEVKKLQAGQLSE